MRLTAFVAAAVATGLLFGKNANAQQAGFAVDRFEPAERGSDWFTLDSLDLRGDARPAFGVVGEYNARPLVIYDTNGNIKESVVRNQFILHAGAAFVFLDRFRVAADMPFQLFADGHQGTLNGVTYFPPANDQALGDLRLSADARIFGEYGDVMTLAIGAQISLPTGSQSNYMSDGQVRFMPRAVVAGDVGPIAYSARLGIQYRGSGANVDGDSIDSEFDFGGSVGLRAFNHALLIGPEIYGSTTFENPLDKQSTPLEALLGPHIFLENGLRFGAGAGTGLTRGLGSPVARALLNIEYVPPISAPPPAVRHEPPRPAPVVAPPPSDRDHDSIVDDADACPDVAGVASDDPKKNGCPPDKDGDGIFDDVDACIDTPGVASTNPKFNGCPDDIDGDGIKNDVDACPEEKGQPNADPAKNGCPSAFVQNGQIKILDQVRFKTNSAAIVGSDSEDILNAVLKVLNDHPEIKMVSVEGHTDNTGAAAHNKTLSAARAASVVAWLTKHGIDKSRLSSLGYGQERPIAENSTPEGRTQNRRVEFHIVGDSK